MMTFSHTSQFAMTLALTAALGCLSTSPGFAFTSEAQQMCSGDAMRLCASEIPDIARITACMHRQKARVSPGCRAVMDREESSRKSAKAAEN
jgi:hypothetical protein